MFDLLLLDKSVAVMKTAILIFTKIEKTLCKARKIENFQRQIEVCIRSFKRHSDFKLKTSNFFVNEVLYYHIRKLFISEESKPPKKEKSSRNNQKSKVSTMFVRDEISIFGINDVISFSKDYLSNLQPNYFLKGGMGRKSKFTSSYNLRKQERKRNISANNMNIFKGLDTNKSFLTVDSDIEALSSRSEPKVVSKYESLFSLRNFVRPNVMTIMLETSKKKKNEKNQFSLRNIFTFSRRSENDFSNDSEDLNDFGVKQDLISPLHTKRLTVKQSHFEYETEESFLTNFPMEVKENSEIEEDVKFRKFFFDVSNSEMLEKMEKFLVNYLTISQDQRESFSKSTLRRKSLISVLSILKNSEIYNVDSSFPKKKEMEDWTPLLRYGRLRDNDPKIQMLQKFVKLKNRANLFKRKLHRSLEPRLKTLSDVSFL